MLRKVQQLTKAKEEIETSFPVCTSQIEGVPGGLAHWSRYRRISRNGDMLDVTHRVYADGAYYEIERTRISIKHELVRYMPSEASQTHKISEAAFEKALRGAQAGIAAWADES